MWGAFFLVSLIFAIAVGDDTNGECLYAMLEEGKYLYQYMYSSTILTGAGLLMKHSWSSTN